MLRTFRDIHIFLFNQRTERSSSYGEDGGQGLSIKNVFHHSKAIMDFFCEMAPMKNKCDMFPGPPCATTNHGRGVRV